MKKKHLKYTFFGITFTDTNFENLFKNKQKKLIVFPAAPALINIFKDKNYYRSLKNSEFVLFDSGYLCILLKFLKGISVKKFSGLKFLRLFLNKVKKNKKKIYLINPTNIDTKVNKLFLNSLEIKSYKGYTAPYYYKDVKDIKLLKILKKIKPRYILINLGGGTQEKLGFFIKKNINFKCSIICTGAAIAFLTRRQALIPQIIDNLYMGWLFRILFEPNVFFLRYLKSFRLFFMILNSKVSIYEK